jgi:hypothetical protein
MAEILEKFNEVLDPLPKMEFKFRIGRPIWPTTETAKMKCYVDEITLKEIWPSIRHKYDHVLNTAHAVDETHIRNLITFERG